MRDDFDVILLFFFFVFFFFLSLPFPLEELPL